MPRVETTTNTRHKRAKTTKGDADEGSRNQMTDWTGKVFDGDLLQSVTSFLSFRDCAAAARTCKSFAVLVRKLMTDRPSLHRWFAGKPHLSHALTLEPPEYNHDGFDADKKNYVGDMIYLGVYLRNVYPFDRMQRIVESQPEFPWYDENSDDRMKILPSGRTDTELAHLLRGDDAEILRLWVAAGLPNPRLQAALERFGEVQTTETGGFGSYRIYLDGQGDTRIPHITLVGDPCSHPSYGSVEIYDEDDDDVSYPLYPFLLLACSRAQLADKLDSRPKIPETNDDDEMPQGSGSGVLVALPGCDYPPTFSNENKAADLRCSPPLCLVDAEMLPHSGIYSVNIKFDQIQTAAASVGVLCDPIDPKSKRIPQPHEDWTEDMVGMNGELPGSVLHEVTLWSQYGGLGGTTVKRLGSTRSLKDQFPVRGYGQYLNPDGPANEIGMVYDSNDGKLIFVTDGEVQPIVVPVQGVARMRFCVTGGNGDKVSLLQFAREHLWKN